jgi:hypothetical protein
MKYNRALMTAVTHDRIRIARAVNATVTPMDQAPQDYADFDRGASQYSSSIPRVARRDVLRGDRSDELLKSGLKCVQKWLPASQESVVQAPISVC